MKVTKRELITIWNTLENFSKQKVTRNFSYGIIRNKKIIKDEIEALEEAQTPSKEFQEYEKARIIICHKYVDRNDNGEPILNGDQFVFTGEEKQGKERGTLKILNI